MSKSKPTNEELILKRFDAGGKDCNSAHLHMLDEEARAAVRKRLVLACDIADLKSEQKVHLNELKEMGHAASTVRAVEQCLKIDAAQAEAKELAIAEGKLAFGIDMSPMQLSLFEKDAADMKEARKEGNPVAKAAKEATKGAADKKKTATRPPKDGNVANIAETAAAGNA